MHQKPRASAIVILLKHCMFESSLNMIYPTVSNLTNQVLSNEEKRVFLFLCETPPPFFYLNPLFPFSLHHFLSYQRSHPCANPRHDFLCSTWPFIIYPDSRNRISSLTFVSLEISENQERLLEVKSCDMILSKKKLIKKRKKKKYTQKMKKKMKFFYITS